MSETGTLILQPKKTIPLHLCLNKWCWFWFCTLIFWFSTETTNSLKWQTSCRKTRWNQDNYVFVQSGYRKRMQSKLLYEFKSCVYNHWIFLMSYCVMIIFSYWNSLCNSMAQRLRPSSQLFVSCSHVRRHKVSDHLISIGVTHG